MKSRHTIQFSDARDMAGIGDDTIDLVVTSPPYPMIAMWDELFTSFSPEIRTALKKEQGPQAFERMHHALDPVWSELFRVIRPGGFACINIGDATRKIGNDFQLYSNHSRITMEMVRLGFQPLPVILWKKATNAPNKFMGSGMLPAGAYVTLEHEYILIFRKGGKREFTTLEQKKNRNESAIFWEERNRWFSDTWILKGARQTIGKKNIRERNAAFTIDLPFRLINMYSVRGDTVMDPFLGTGTTTAAAIVSGRNSIGFESDPGLEPLIRATVSASPGLSARVTAARLDSHKKFVESRLKDGKVIKHINEIYGFPVVTLQEKQIRLHQVCELVPDRFPEIEARYTDILEPPVMEAVPAVDPADPQTLLSK